MLRTVSRTSFHHKPGGRRDIPSGRNVKSRLRSHARSPHALTADTPATTEPQLRSPRSLLNMPAGPSTSTEEVGDGDGEPEVEAAAAEAAEAARRASRLARPLRPSHTATTGQHTVVGTCPAISMRSTS